MSSLRNRLAVVATAGVVSIAGLGAVAATASATPQSVPQCGNASLAVTSTFAQGGAGHSWMDLVYRNQTTHSCSVYGYPGLDAINATGHVLAHAARTTSGYGGGGHLGTVTIQPGGYASASVEWLNFNGHTGGACGYSTAINTIVANTSAVHRLPVSVSVCSLQVHPTVAGTPDYPDYGPAQRFWIQGASADAASMNYYFLHAEHELQAGGDYPTQVAELASLSSLPDTGLTPAQIAVARADVKALDSFFVTPGLYA